MHTFTNMAWPDDPYGTGQLWRQEPQLLAGFAITGTAADQAPRAYAVTYLRLHRTKAVELTAGVSFGFRAAATVAGDDMGELAGLLDLDALRARRLAKVVAGFAHSTPSPPSSPPSFAPPDTTRSSLPTRH